MCKSHVNPSLPAPSHSELADTSVDQSMSIFHVNVSQHVAMLASTLGLVAALLLCIFMYCTWPYFVRCIRCMVSQEESMSEARSYTARAYPAGSYPSTRHPGPSRPDGQSSFITPAAPLSLTNQSEDNSGESKEPSPVPEKKRNRRTQHHSSKK